MKPQVGRWRGEVNRPALARMLWLIEQACAPAGVCPISAAVELEVHRKTVDRDIEFLRDRLALPLRRVTRTRSVRAIWMLDAAAPPPWLRALLEYFRTNSEGAKARGKANP